MPASRGGSSSVLRTAAAPFLGAKWWVWNLGGAWWGGRVLARCWALRNQARGPEFGVGLFFLCLLSLFRRRCVGGVGVGGWGVWSLDSGREHLAMAGTRVLPGRVFSLPGGLVCVGCCLILL